MSSFRSGRFLDLPVKFETMFFNIFFVCEHEHVDHFLLAFSDYNLGRWCYSSVAGLLYLATHLSIHLAYPLLTKFPTHQVPVLTTIIYLSNFVYQYQVTP
jgi:hypothetical protein